MHVPSVSLPIIEANDARSESTRVNFQASRPIIRYLCTFFFFQCKLTPLPFLRKERTWLRVLLSRTACSSFTCIFGNTFQSKILELDDRVDPAMFISLQPRLYRLVKCKAGVILLRLPGKSDGRSGIFTDVRRYGIF